MIAKKRKTVPARKKTATRRAVKKTGPRRVVHTARLKPFAWPKIGTDFEAMGGVFIGVLAGENGAEDEAVFVGPELDAGTHGEVVERAKAANYRGVTGYTAGSRRAHRLAVVNAKHLFKAEWYWTEEQHASYSYNAWSQTFDNGNQLYWSKDGKVRGRAFRSLPISRFINFLGKAGN